MNHRTAAMCVAFHACRHAGFTSNAARGVDEELIVRADHAEILSTRHAQTLYSGIFEIGSSFRFVRRFADFFPGQWYGTNTVSGRMVFTNFAGTTISPRRVITRTSSRSRIPKRAANIG